MRVVDEVGVRPEPREKKLVLAEEGQRVRGLRFLAAHQNCLTFDVETEDVGRIVGINGRVIRAIQVCTGGN